MLDGLLFFPVTPFDSSGHVDLAAFAEHLDRGVGGGAGAVFVACGTGEFHALNAAEHSEIVRTAVAVTAGRVPVFAGAGGPIAVAQDCARATAEAGGDGILLLPPYLVRAPAAGIVRYVRDVSAATALPIIVYQRDGVLFTPETAAEIVRLPHVSGFKDGIGDFESLAPVIDAIRRERGPDFQFFNGMPTAEVSQPRYAELGVGLYSSAVYAFLPELALAFYRAQRDGDRTTTELLLEQFYRPLARIRDRVPGYAVALVKAGLTLRGIAAGGVRAPLVDPAPQDLEDLKALIEHGLEVLGQLDVSAAG